LAVGHRDHRVPILRKTVVASSRLTALSSPGAPQRSAELRGRTDACNTVRAPHHRGRAMQSALRQLRLPDRLYQKRCPLPPPEILCFGGAHRRLHEDATAPRGLAISAASVAASRSGNCASSRTNRTAEPGHEPRSGGSACGHAGFERAICQPVSNSVRNPAGRRMVIHDQHGACKKNGWAVEGVGASGARVNAAVKWNRLPPGHSPPRSRPHQRTTCWRWPAQASASYCRVTKHPPGKGFEDALLFLERMPIPVSVTVSKQAFLAGRGNRSDPVGRAKKSACRTRSRRLGRDFALLGELEGIADEVIEDWRRRPTSPTKRSGNLGSTRRFSSSPSLRRAG